MARQGIRDIQVAFFWGRKTTTEINALIAAGELVEGDMIFNTDTHHMMVYSQSGSAEPISDNVDSYQFYLKYPYVDEELQKLKIANSGRIISVKFNQAIGASELTIDACSSISGWVLGTGASGLFLHNNVTESYFKNSTTGTAIGFYKTDVVNSSVAVSKNVSAFSFEDRQIVFETYFPSHAGVASIDFTLITNAGNKKVYNLTKQMDNSSITDGVNKFFIDYQTSVGTVMGNYDASSITGIEFKVNLTSPSITFSTNSILLSNIQTTYLLKTLHRMTDNTNWIAVAGLATHEVRVSPIWEVRNNYTVSTNEMIMDIEPTIIDDFNTTAGWVVTTTSGSVTANTAPGLRDNCLKVEYRNLNGWAEVTKAVSFNATTRRIRASCIVSSLTNVTNVYIKLQSSTGNFVTWEIPSTELVAGLNNTITIDPTDVFSGKLGTLNPSNITSISLGVSTSSEVQLDAYWDSLYLVEGNIVVDEMDSLTGWSFPVSQEANLSVAGGGRKENCLQVASTFTPDPETGSTTHHGICKSIDKLSFLNKYIELSINPQTLADVILFYVKLSTEKNDDHITWRIQKEDIVENTWNIVRINTASTPYSSVQGTDLGNITYVEIGHYINKSTTVKYDCFYLNPLSDYYELPFTKEIGTFGGGKKEQVTFLTKVGDTSTTRGKYTISPLSANYKSGSILGDYMVGASSLMFDKTGINTEAGIQNYNIGTTDLTQKVVGFWIKLKEEDVTKLESIDLYLGQTTPGVTWRKFSVNKDSLGKDLIAGWNYLEYFTDHPSSVITAGNGGLTACNRISIHIVTKNSSDTLTDVVLSHLNYSKNATGDLAVCTINGTSRKIKNKNLLYTWHHLSPKIQEIAMTDLDFTTILVNEGEYFTVSPRYGDYGKNALFEIKVEKD